MRNVMKKKPITIIVVFLILANVFFSTSPAPDKESLLTLVLLEARADEPVETDPPDPDPDPDPIPLRPFPSDWTLSAIIDYLF
jgi:hypothetical protein